MKKVQQKEVSKTTGDCMRAAIASVLELELEAVPHLTKTPEIKWFSVMYYFLVSYEYLYCGMWYPNQSKRKLLKRNSFNGFYLASVNSRTYEGITHMVIINKDCKVIHDPHPSKAWQDEQLIGNKDFNSAYKFKKMNSTDKNYWHYL